MKVSMSQELKGVRWATAGKHCFVLLVLGSTPVACGMSGLPGDISEEPVTSEKRKKGWRISCDIGEATEG